MLKIPMGTIDITDTRLHIEKRASLSLCLSAGELLPILLDAP
jgi:hypothetical protein